LSVRRETLGAVEAEEEPGQGRARHAVTVKVYVVTRASGARRKREAHPWTSSELCDAGSGECVSGLALVGTVPRVFSMDE
jgi:hypothetical protein